jgi:phenylalanyl-tRNA synthetase beta chain
VRVPLSWLREFVALPNDTADVAERLALLGFPAAEIVRRPRITGVVTARIAKLERHPNADRLQVGEIDVGGDEPLVIATAATNVAAGQTIAVATIGAKLPELTIAPRTMRGIASQGMMISAEELALPSEWFEDGIMQLDDATPLGIDAADLFGLNDDVIDVEITTNRPDAMSIAGLARELAAAYDVPLQLPSFDNPAAGQPPFDAITVDIESADCTRFVAQYADNVRVAPAPAWMRVRLALAGQRPINNLVDISNYAMLETGQPLHFYDATRIEGGTLVVRSARDGETIVTLDDVERKLTAGSLVIADAQRPLGLAGLMGSQTAEVNDATTAILMEAANFNGPRVRRMSAALGLRTEASSRHEKSLALALSDMGAARAATLLRGIGAHLRGPAAYGEAVTPAAPIGLPFADIERLLGIAVPPQRVERHLRALGCTVPQTDATHSSVVPPLWRRDLTIAADLVEEVARIEGYDRIPAIVPSVAAHEISSAAFEREREMARALVTRGYREVVSLSLRSAGTIPVRNPLSDEARFLRDSLVPGALEYLASSPLGTRIFEIGDVFAGTLETIDERASAIFGFSSPRRDEPLWTDADFRALKGDCEDVLRRLCGRSMDVAAAALPDFHPGRAANVTVDGAAAGYLGAVDPRIVARYDIQGNVHLCVLDVRALPEYRTPRYRPPSKFPSTYRDLALIVSVDVSAGDVEASIAATLGNLCTGASVFDEYRGPQIGEARKSLAVRVTLQKRDATITDEEADAAVARLLVSLRERFGAELRA